MSLCKGILCYGTPNRCMRVCTCTCVLTCLGICVDRNSCFGSHICLSLYVRVCVIVCTCLYVYVYVNMCRSIGNRLFKTNTCYELFFLEILCVRSPFLVTPIC